MRWVAYLELRGLHAAVHRGQASRELPPLLVIRDGLVWDGCPRAWNQGIAAGMPRRQALRQVPGALAVEYGAVDYTPVARAFWNQAAEHSGRVEPVADHQLFLDLSGPGEAPPRQELAALMAGAVAAVAAVARVPPAELLPLAGVATGKLVARAAALVAPPGRPAAVARGDEPAFLAGLPVTALWRARRELQERLRQLGLARIGDVARVPEAELRRQFGLEGQELARWVRGIDPEPVLAAWPPRTVSRRVAFAEGAPPAALQATLGQLGRELAAELTGQSEVARAIALEVEWAAGTARAQRQLPRRAFTAGALEQPLQTLLREALHAVPRGSRLLALTVTAGDLQPAGHRQLDIWGMEQQRAEERRERLEQALGVLRARFPARWVQMGAPAENSRREAMYGFYDPLRWVSPGLEPS